MTEMAAIGFPNPFKALPGLVFLVIHGRNIMREGGVSIYTAANELPSSNPEHLDTDRQPAISTLLQMNGDITTSFSRLPDYTSENLQMIWKLHQKKIDRFFTGMAGISDFIWLMGFTGLMFMIFANPSRILASSHDLWRVGIVVALRISLPLATYWLLQKLLSMGIRRWMMGALQQ